MPTDLSPTAPSFPPGLSTNWRWARTGLGWVASEVAAVWRFEFLPATWREPFAYGLRTWLACMLALYLSFLLQIDEPLWAALTVWQVIQPAPGMAISKGLYRVVGVIIGAIAGVVLIALFSQAPELYMLALALWVGGATIAATLFTNFRGFAGVSAGFMAALVSLDAYGVPERVFDIAMARSSATIIGIACSVLVTTLFAPHRAQAQMVNSMRQAIVNTARRVAFPLGGALADRIALGPPLAGALVRLETQIEFAAKESAAGRASASPARRLVAHLFACLAARCALEEHLGRVGLIQDDGTVALFQEGMRLFAQLPAIMTPGREAEVAASVRAWQGRVRQHQPKDSPDEVEAISTQLIHDRLADLAWHFERAVTLWIDLQNRPTRSPDFQLNFHRDRRNAVISGLRSFLTVLAAGAFWIASQWSAGPVMMIPIVMVGSVFASAPYPEALALNFTRGAACGLGAAYICTFYFLSSISGFVPFAAVEALFLIPAAMIQLNPKYTSFGFAYGIFFFLVGAPSNVMVFDPAAFLNNALAVLAGAFIATMAFRLFMPPDPPRARRYVVSRMRDGLRDMARQEPIPGYPDWQTRNFDRVYRLCDPANPAAVKTYEWYVGGLATVHLGDEILRLRHLLEDHTLPQRLANLGISILRAFDRMTTDPNPVLPAVEKAMASRSEIAPPGSADGRLAWKRFHAVVGEIRAFFVVYPQFLTSA